MRCQKAGTVCRLNGNDYSFFRKKNYNKGSLQKISPSPCGPGSHPKDHKMSESQMSEFAKRHVHDFLTAIEPFSDAYGHDSFSYLAIRMSEGLVLIQGTLFLNVQQPTIPLKIVDTKRVQAGHFYLNAVGLTREQAIDQLLTGKMTTPSGELLFPTNPGSNRYGSQYQPYHDIGIRSQSRLTHLAILGAETREYLDQPHLDWELRAAATPYDGIQDILQEFQPGVLRGVNCVEIAAMRMAAIDTNSIVNGETASLTVRIPSIANENKVSVGIRVLEQGRVIRREQLPAENFKWEKHDGYKSGQVELAVPKAAVVHGIANYNDVTQHHYFFGDPTSFQNPRRAAYESFDPKFSTINDILARSQAKRSSREFEASMSWLFWMLGFAPAYLGSLPDSSDAADFLAVTPNGNLAVVECTVGLLKDNDKLPKLHDRVQAVRRNLETSSTRHVRVLPVIITAKSAEEVRPDIEQAEKLGIFVLTREGIEEMLRRTLIPQNADQLYDEAEQATKSAKEARDNQLALPLVEQKANLD
jgi:hypothetical protein